jgi:hypothetical protein
VRPTAAAGSSAGGRGLVDGTGISRQGVAVRCGPRLGTGDVDPCLDVCFAGEQMAEALRDRARGGEILRSGVQMPNARVGILSPDSRFGRARTSGATSSRRSTSRGGEGDGVMSHRPPCRHRTCRHPAPPPPFTATMVDALPSAHTGAMTDHQADLIVTDPDVVHGQARVRGLRIPVSVVLDCLAGAWVRTRSSGSIRP